MRSKGSPNQLQQKSPRTIRILRARRCPSTNAELRNAGGSGNPVCQRYGVLFTEENKVVEFNKQGIFLHEYQNAEGSILQTQIDYFHDPRNRNGKHLVTLTQRTGDECLVLTNTSNRLKARHEPNFQSLRDSIIDQLKQSRNERDKTLQRHLFFMHVEADERTQFQSFDKKYYLYWTNSRLRLEQNQGNEAGLHFIVKRENGETLLPRSCSDPVCSAAPCERT